MLRLHRQNFYPRSPQGERRVVHLPTGRCKRISIHVPRKGNVLPWSAPRLPAYHFYPRSPCGERQLVSPQILSHPGFLSTFPLRGTSTEAGTDDMPFNISIHVPLAGNVGRTACSESFRCRFLSTFPLRGTSPTLSLSSVRVTFLSTFPLRGTSQARCTGPAVAAISIHVPLAGNVQNWEAYEYDGELFLSTFPLRGTSGRGDGH